MLTRKQERLDQLALSANYQARKPLVPLTVGDVWFGIQPLRQQLEVGCWNLPALDAIEQMLELRRRDVLAADLRHRAF